MLGRPLSLLRITTRQLYTLTRFSPSIPLSLHSIPTSTLKLPFKRNMSTQGQDQKQHKGDITSWASKDGEFRRQQSTFRDAIEKNGQFPPEKGRYILYVSLACPWAYVELNLFF